MSRNKLMRECLKVTGIVLVSAAMAAAAPGKPAKPTSVVRVDRRTGRLIRTVVVPPSPVPVTAAAPALVVNPAPATASDAPPPAPAPQTVRSPKTAIGELIENTAKRYEVDPLLVHSVVEVESNYNPYALSPKGAQGLMQLIPSTARRFGVANTFDVKQNLEGGVRYLKYLQTLFPNDLSLAIAAYNAGEGAVWKYGNAIPPYRETVQYVQKVGAKYGKARRAQAQKPSGPAAPVIAAATIVQEERYAPIETYIDAEGRLNIRTKQRDETRTP